MATFTKVVLNNAAGDGLPIKVVATSSAGTTIHTAHATSIDEIYLYACNTSTASILLTLEWGGTASPDNLIEFNIPAESGLFCISPGLILTGGLVVGAFAASADLITITGFVNRIG